MSELPKGISVQHLGRAFRFEIKPSELYPGLYCARCAKLNTRAEKLKGNEKDIRRVIKKALKGLVKT